MLYTLVRDRGSTLTTPFVFLFLIEKISESFPFTICILMQYDTLRCTNLRGYIHRSDTGVYKNCTLVGLSERSVKVFDICRNSICYCFFWRDRILVHGYFLKREFFRHLELPLFRSATIFVRSFIGFSTWDVIPSVRLVEGLLLALSRLRSCWLLWLCFQFSVGCDFSICCVWVGNLCIHEVLQMLSSSSGAANDVRCRKNCDGFFLIPLSVAIFECIDLMTVIIIIWSLFLI